MLDQEAAEDRADRQGQSRNPGPGPDRLAALMGREGVGDDRKRAGHHESGADALKHAAGDQGEVAGREAGRGRSDGEDDHAEGEGLAAAEDVTDPAADRQQHRERERVAVDDPFEAGDRGVEVALNRGEGDVDDGVVEHHHEQGQAHRAQRPPLAVLVGDQVLVLAHC
ncbi:MAG: hypothetical protein U0R29_00500 [Solirubrobacterales bacterium]